MSSCGRHSPKTGNNFLLCCLMLNSITNKAIPPTWISVAFPFVPTRSIENDLRQQVSEMRQLWASFQPRMAIVQVGGREDSNVYIRMKLKAAENIGILAEHIKLPRDCTQTEVRDLSLQSLLQSAGTLCPD